MNSNYDEISKAGKDVENERNRLADAVVAQNTRMDKLEAKSGINRESYDLIVEAAKRVQDNSIQLRNDVDDLMERVKALEDNVND